MPRSMVAGLALVAALAAACDDGPRPALQIAVSASPSAEVLAARAGPRSVRSRGHRRAPDRAHLVRRRAAGVRARSGRRHAHERGRGPARARHRRARAAGGHGDRRRRRRGSVLAQRAARHGRRAARTAGRRRAALAELLRAARDARTKRPRARGRDPRAGRRDGDATACSPRARSTRSSAIHPGRSTSCAATRVTRWATAQPRTVAVEVLAFDRTVTRDRPARRRRGAARLGPGAREPGRRSDRARSRSWPSASA